MGAAAAVMAAAERCGIKEKLGPWQPPRCPHQGLQAACPEGAAQFMKTGPGTAQVLTSHIQVGGGRVACACRVGRHTLVLALVRLLAALNLQGTCGDMKTGFRPGTWVAVSTAFVACVDQMLQTLGPYPSTSAICWKLLPTSPVASGLESRVALWSTILPRSSVWPISSALPPTPLSAHCALARMHPQ